MRSNTNSADLSQLSRFLSDSWSAYFAQALETMTGEKPRITCTESPEAASPESGEVFWWEQPFNVAVDAVAHVGATESSWSAIGERALKAAGVEDVESADRHATYQELLQQSLSGLAQAMGAKLGREVACEGGREASPPPCGPPIVAQLAFGEEEHFPLLLLFSPALLAAIDDPPADREADSGEQSTPASATLTREEQPRTMELLLDVELPVSVSFGRATLLLKEVLKLTSGSIVELNRSASEPVEVIVNNCVIARGEVVVIEGNYGVKITQIISRQERLRTLN